MTLSQLLSDLQASADGVALVRGKSLRQWWGVSERADHMLWLVGRMTDKPGWPTRQAVVSAACACAETALPYCSAAARPMAETTIETARAWTRGEATLEQVRGAASATFAAADYAIYAAATGAAAAACAVSAACGVVACAASATGAYAAATADYAAAATADYAACGRPKALREMAALVRQVIPADSLPDLPWGEEAA